MQGGIAKGQNRSFSITSRIGQKSRGSSREKVPTVMLAKRAITWIDFRGNVHKVAIQWKRRHHNP